MGLGFRERMFPCPNCKTMCKVHQYEDRYYSHPRIMMMSTVLKIRVPKLHCLVCDGYPQAAVPVARPNVSYTRLMEQEVFHLLADMCISSVARNTGLTCRIIFQMIRYRVEQALVLLDLSDARVLYVDETSSKKGHNYITVVSDQNKRIVFLCEGKDSRTMDRLRDWLLEHNGDPERIEWVSCDLGEAYPSGVRRNFPNAVIIYDHFHVSKLFNDAFDKLLSEEMEEHENLKKERQRLLMNPSSFESEHERSRILAFADQFQRVGRGYRLKTLLGSIYGYADKDEAACCLDLWYEEVIRFGQKDMTRAAKSIMQRKEGILAWYDNPISNGYAEGINSMIQTTKRIAFGHANVENFMMLVYLRNGNLKIVFDRGPHPRVRSRQRACLSSSRRERQRATDNQSRGRGVSHAPEPETPFLPPPVEPGIAHLPLPGSSARRADSRPTCILVASTPRIVVSHFSNPIC